MNSQPAETLFARSSSRRPTRSCSSTRAGTISLANPRTSELFGYEPGELVGKGVDVLVPARLRATHAGSQRRLRSRSATREMGVGLELHGVRKDGSEFPVEISLSPFGAGSDELVITFVRDATERRAAEAGATRARPRAGCARGGGGGARGASSRSSARSTRSCGRRTRARLRFSFVSGRAETVLGLPGRALAAASTDFWARPIHPDDRELA